LTPPGGVLGALALAVFSLGCGSPKGLSPDGGASQGGNVAADSNSDGSDAAGSNVDLDARSDSDIEASVDVLAGPDGDLDGSADGNAIAPEDEQICLRFSDALVSVSCPDQTGRVPKCEATFARGGCLPELRVLFSCDISAGAAAFFCDGTVSRIMPGFCDTEEAALRMCVVGI
jgi:hypothetical protein